MISETWHRFQALLMTLQKILQFGQKLFAFSNIGKLNDEVMIFDHTDHNHGFLIGVLEKGVIMMIFILNLTNTIQTQGPTEPKYQGLIGPLPQFLTLIKQD
jgi:hypothetical protein